jgi:Uma2 family endonuclease
VTTAPSPRRFNVEEYYRMGEAGIFAPDERVELIEGAIIQMSPIGSRHAAAVTRTGRWFDRRVGDRATMRTQNPVRLSPHSEPEPDVALVRPRADDYATAHPEPADVFLIIEVADTTVAYDQDTKLPLYAAAGIPEVWIANLRRDQITAHRNPVNGAYQDSVTIGRDGSLAPLAFPDLVIRGADILG